MNEARQKLLAYYADKPAEFIQDYVCIEFVGHTPLVQPFKLWEYQNEQITNILSHRLNVILKARQLGYTWVVLSMCVWKLLTQPGFRMGAISRSEDEAKELIRRAGVILEHMPDLVQDARSSAPGWTGPMYTANALEITVDFPDGKPACVFKAFNSNSSAGRSFTFDWLFLDEWAFHPCAEEIWASIFPTVNDGSAKVIGLSTIERGSLFEKVFTGPDNGFYKIFLPWNVRPDRDDAWYRSTLGALGPEKTMAEYPATIEEALMVPGGRMFPEVRRETHIRAHDDFWKGRVSRYVAIDYGLDMFSCHWIAVNEMGYARVYREFDSPNLTIGQACDVFKTQNGDEDILYIFAPPDLWNRDQVHGKSRAQFFAEGGMVLTKVSNDFPAGVAGMKQWLTADEKGTARLTIEDAPNLFNCLQKILIDPNRPDVYAKKPHDLTHDPDSLRYFCVYYVYPTKREKPKPSHKWTEDLREDYENGSAEIREMMRQRYGEPY